ncbi:MAG: hypothetical protein IJH64_01460 [Oscillospiraceae bacterium]|nr:hypothetical protein [Oscillospiraceae bacterium]
MSIKKMTYQRLIEIIKNERAIMLKDVFSAIGNMLGQSTDESDEYGEYMYENDTRTKLRALAQQIADEELIVHADATDYHNLAVYYARQDLSDCSLKILNRGLKPENYPFSSDLLADTVLYGKENGQHKVCESALSSLSLVDKESWGWRAYSFTIDYYLDKVTRLPKGASRNKLKKEIHRLADEFIDYSQRDSGAIDRAYCKKAEVIQEIGGEGDQEKYLLEGCQKDSSAPQCSLRLADIMFKRGNYEKVLEYLQNCKRAVNHPQPDISPEYVYLLYAMSKTSKLMIDTPDGNYSEKRAEIEAIYRDFHTAMKSFTINRTYENAAKKTIRMLEIQTGVKDKTIDPDEEEYT